MKQHTPVNTGKVLIGVYYEPKQRELTEEETYLQEVLIGNHSARGAKFSVGTALLSVFTAYAVCALIYYVIK